MFNSNSKKSNNSRRVSMDTSTQTDLNTTFQVMDDPSYNPMIRFVEETILTNGKKIVIVSCSCKFDFGTQTQYNTTFDESIDTLLMNAYDDESHLWQQMLENRRIQRT